MVFDWEGELVESDTAVSCLLAPQENELLVPSIENAVQLNIENLPPELLSMVFSVGDVFFSLLQIFQNPITDDKLLWKLLYLHKWRVRIRSFGLEIFSEWFYSLVANVLPYDELIFSDFFVWVLVIIFFLWKVNSHTAQEFRW